MNIFTITITQDDIQQGQISLFRRCQECPIYLAAQRVIPNISYISPNCIVLNNGERIELPEEAKQFIKKADFQVNILAGRINADEQKLEPLQPFSFQVYYRGN